MPKKYRKKPVVIESVKWNGNNLDEILEFVGEPAYVVGGELFIKTLEGDHRANVGDFVIKGVAGEFYPCKPHVFHKTYEPEVKEVLGDE